MDIISLQILFLIFLIFIFLCFYFDLIKSKPLTPFGFSSYPLVGTVPEFVVNRHRFLEWTTEVLARTPTNTAILNRPGKIKGFLTANPANVEHMIKTNLENYPKGARFINLLGDFLGRGIFNAEGESWRAQRKIASHEFNTRSLRNFVMEVAVVELRDRFIPILEKTADMNQVVDLQDLLERFTFDNICKIAFNVDPGCLSGDITSGTEFMKAFEEAATNTTRRFLSVFPGLHKVRKLLKCGSEIKLQQSIETVHKFAGDIIKSRMDKKEGKPDEDLLSRFMGNPEYSPEFLRDIVISFILAGRDTTSSALTWFFWLLASHPEVEYKILEELKTIRLRSEKNHRELYSFDELRQMHYLHSAISEGLRLYPPVPVDTKDCLKDDVMPDGTFVGKGWYITYSSYAMGRMESVWGQDRLEFRPERWLVEEEGGRGNMVYKPENQYKYPVFHGGPRVCLGKEMAYIQMKLIASTIIEMFKIDTVVPADDKNPPEHVMSLTIRMKDGLKVRVKKR
uniref:cytochrome P450 94B3-like n=1 Tax=Erigeron canadensis TaxID=72917 RepID=UPI001CB8EEC6|nr:cytochrome P450 94B3-like [Erigeron canadensis]